jgi:hypothetical protein
MKTKRLTDELSEAQDIAHFPAVLLGIIFTQRCGERSFPACEGQIAEAHTLIAVLFPQ